MSTQDEIKYWKSLLAKKDEVANLAINAALSHSNKEIAALKAIIAQLVEALKDAHPHVAHSGTRIAIGAALAAAGAA